MKASKIPPPASRATPESGAGQQDAGPLKHTRKLAAQGHARLYHAGAFEIPATTLHMVPPVPGAFNLASQKAGKHTRLTFEDSIKRARDSFGLTEAGVKASSNAAVAIQQGTSHIVKGARAASRYGARKTGDSLRMIRDSVNSSLSRAGKIFHAAGALGDESAQNALKAGGKFYKGVKNTSARMWADTIELTARISRTSFRASRRHASHSGEQFLKDYSALPANIKARMKNIARGLSFGRFIRAYGSASRWRAKLSRQLMRQLSETTRRNHYVNNIKASFQLARGELKETHDSGYTFALLKSLRWVLQGILWEAAFKPVIKIMAALLGYIVVNTAVFPAQLAFNVALVVVITAAQTLWNSAVIVYEILAPSIITAAVILFSAVELLGGQALAGASLIVGSLGTALTFVLGKMTAAVITAGGYIAGKTLQYVGAPLTGVGFAIGGCVFGVLAGTATALGGCIIVTAGVVGEAAAEIIGNFTAGGALVSGIVASVLAGTALGVYRLAKAVVVPIIYQLEAAFIVTYCLLTQLGAHAVLALADLSYMVFSLEGGKWMLSIARGRQD